MLFEFIVANREVIAERVRLRVRGASDHKPLETKVERGVPLFLTQLIEALDPAASLEARDQAGKAQTKAIALGAALHGQRLLRNGFSVAQVVHGYGDVCQVVTELAKELGAPIGANEFQVFNGCLDDAIAGAVTAYGAERERDLAYRGTVRTGILAHELRNLLNAAILSFDVIRKGQVGFGGSTGAILSRSLAGLRVLAERSLAEVRLDADKPMLERIVVRNFIEELEPSTQMQADGFGLHLTISPVDSDVMIDADSQLLSSAVSNLLHNAFKFTPHGSIGLTVRATAERVFIEVSDECGGLPAGKAEELFRPFTQKSDDRTGVGLGLTIALNAAHACAGELYVRNLPGKGCVFTLDLPRWLGTSNATQAVDGAKAVG